MNSAEPCPFDYRCLLLSTFGPSCYSEFNERYESEEMPLQLSKRFFGLKHAMLMAKAFLHHSLVSESQKNANPFLSVCHAKTEDSRDAQHLPAKMLELLLFIRNVRYQLQYPHQMI